MIILHYLEGFEERYGHRDPNGHHDSGKFETDSHFYYILLYLWLDKIITISYTFGQEVLPALRKFARQLVLAANSLLKQHDDIMDQAGKTMDRSEAWGLAAPYGDVGCCQRVCAVVVRKCIQMLEKLQDTVSKTPVKTLRQPDESPTARSKRERISDRTSDGYPLRSTCAVDRSAQGQQAEAARLTTPGSAAE